VTGAVPAVAGVLAILAITVTRERGDELTRARVRGSTLPRGVQT
jgi:hypothetical protein